MSEPTAEERIRERAREIEIGPYTSPELVRAIRARVDAAEKQATKRPLRFGVVVAIAAGIAATVLAALLFT